jgi:hypothetical protein
MTQVSDQINLQPVRSFSPMSILPIVFGVLLLVGAFLPQMTATVESVTPSTTTLLILSAAAIGLALWTLYDIRGRFISSLLSFVIGIAAVITLFNFVSALSRSVTAAGEAHVGIGFWVSLIGALGLVLQLFLPRRKLVGVKAYGEEGLNDFMARMGVLGELLGFLWKRKLYWLIPMVLTLMVFIVLIVAGSNSAIAPFIYTLF